MIDVGIIGATGYTGEELINILLKHPEARITYLAAKIDKLQNISEIFKKFRNRTNLICEKPDYTKVIHKCDLLFTALPHTVSMKIISKLSKSKLRIIDLSADYRLKDTKVYEQFYKAKHKDKVGLREAVYGLPEIYRQKIKNAKLIANPGCYPTAATLAILPSLVSGHIDPDFIFIDAKSGTTGAGRKASLDFFFAEVNENFMAYKINTHQHMPEISQTLSKFTNKGKVNVSFVPHLLPINRGILETIYLRKTSSSKLQASSLIKLYKKFYKREPFVRILEEGKFPQLKDVVNTNYCDIGIRVDSKKNVIIIVAAIDNLLKGAAGQAVQNMNIMYKFPENMGLV